MPALPPFQTLKHDKQLQPSTVLCLLAMRRDWSCQLLSARWRARTRIVPGGSEFGQVCRPRRRPHHRQQLSVRRAHVIVASVVFPQLWCLAFNNRGESHNIAEARRARAPENNIRNAGRKVGGTATTGTAARVFQHTTTFLAKRANLEKAAFASK